LSIRSRDLLLCSLAFAAACSQPSSDASHPSAGPLADRGAQIYTQNCLPCHRENGRGVRNVYPSLAGSPAVLGDPGELARWILSQKRPDSIPAGRYPTQMLPFGWMKDADVAALLTYIRANFGNAAPPVDAGTVAQAR
jgi:mono/diheme cytochrome c family protein